MSEPTRVELGDKPVSIERSFARIDMDNLVEEVSEGNSEAVWWGILHARAEAEASRAKTRIDVVKAEAAKKARSDKVTRGRDFTVDVIKDEVTLDPAVREAVEDHIKAQERADILRAARDGAVGKARTLEKLSTLVAEEHGASRPPILKNRTITKRPVE